jgi:hypothetical protein
MVARREMDSFRSGITEERGRVDARGNRLR